MEDKIFTSLLTLYASKGISFEHLLRNELFKSLPAEAKIRLLKEHASELSDGIKFDSSDVKYLLKTIGSGAFAGFMLHKAYTNIASSNNSNPVLATIMAGLSSVPLKNAYTNASNLYSDVAKKDMYKDSLKNIDDTKAITLLAKLEGLQHKRT